MENSAQTTMTEATEVKYLNSIGMPQEYKTQNLYDYISLLFTPLEALFDVASRDDEAINSFIDIAEPAFKTSKDKIYEAIDFIAHNHGSIGLDVNYRRWFDMDILGVTFKPAHENKYQDPFEMAKNSLELCKQGAFTNIEAYKERLRCGIKEADTVIDHAEDMKQKAEALKAEAAELLHKFETGVLTLRRQ